MSDQTKDIWPAEVDDLKIGIYEHHGRFYKFEDLCRMHSDDTLYVSYTPLWTDPRYRGPRTSIRPLQEFCDEFNYVGPVYSGEPVNSTREPCEGASEGA